MPSPRRQQWLSLIRRRVVRLRWTRPRALPFVTVKYQYTHPGTAITTLATQFFQFTEAMSRSCQGTWPELCWQKGRLSPIIFNWIGFASVHGSGRLDLRTHLYSYWLAISIDQVSIDNLCLDLLTSGSWSDNAANQTFLRDPMVFLKLEVSCFFADSPIARCFGPSIAPRWRWTTSAARPPPRRSSAYIACWPRLLPARHSYRFP